MEICRVCEKMPGLFTCPCGRFVYCTPECFGKSTHIKECDFQKLDFARIVSIMHAFMPVFEAVKEDKELYEKGKVFLEELRDKLNKSEFN